MLPPTSDANVIDDIKDKIVYKLTWRIYTISHMHVCKETKRSQKIIIWTKKKQIQIDKKRGRAQERTGHNEKILLSDIY